MDSAPSAKRLSAFARFMTPGRVLSLGIAINLLNYLDRGIVPGAYEQLGDFIQHELHVNSTDVELGGLQSAFIAGYAVASVGFGHMVHHFPPFKLMTVGLGIWCCAVILSGAAPNFPVLVIARMLSGVGEASFQCIVPPWLDDHAPPEKRGLWLALFFMAIPVGTAIGYGYGAVVASAVSWRLAFLLEAPMMFPLACMCWFLDYDGGRTKAPVVKKLAINDADDFTVGLLASSGDAEPQPQAPGVLDELKTVLGSPVFVCTVLGYASYAFVTAGFAAFGPIFLSGLQLFHSEKAASLTFGGVIAVTGFIGTAAGGVILDKLQQRDIARENARRAGRTRGLSLNAGAAVGAGDPKPSSRDGPVPMEVEQPPTSRRSSRASSRGSAGELHEDSPAMLDSKLAAATPFTAIAIVIGFGCCLLAPFVAAAHSLSTARLLFFIVLGVGTIFLFSTTSAVNLAIMSSVPPDSRSFAIGISTIIMHGLGDVLSPTIVGAIADKLSPEHPHQQRSAAGLRTTLLLLILWLAWALLFWGLAWMFAVRRRRQNRRTESLKAGVLHAGDSAPPRGQDDLFVC